MLSRKTARLRLGRATAGILNFLGQTRFGRFLIIAARKRAFSRTFLSWMLAFRGTFPSLHEAERCIAQYTRTGHEHPREHELQSAKAEITRESDYPVLFFLAPFKDKLRSVFDLGGGIGNLFYVLDRHLNLPNDLTWTVYDLPARRRQAVAFAERRNETRIRVTDDLASASGVDLFLVVGALQYFEQRLPESLASLQTLPTHVIVNRSPCFTGQDLITVQDYGDWVFPCKLHDVNTLVLSMKRLGYGLVAEWPAHERRLRIPLFPEYTESYRGFYFRLSAATQAGLMRQACA
jgi:putative methyltransferase (TIGR04325 family)